MPGVTYKKLNLPRCRQGDVFRDVDVIDAVEEGQATEGDDISEGDQPGTLTERHVPYCVVLSQDCDLEHDFNSRAKADRKNNDKFVPALLVAPAYAAAAFKDGDHLKDLKLKMMAFGKSDWERLQKNHFYRYHCLQQSAPELQVPELVIDFKHFFTVPRETFYREFKPNYLASIDDLFREDLSNRFAYYLSRIGLPEPEAA